MKREDIFEYVEEKYDVKPDNPWEKYPNYRVLRHQDNDKWFGLVMDVEKEKIDLGGEGRADILDVKCDPGEISDLKEKEGIIEAYHMDKDNWISVILDSDIDSDEVYTLIDNSFAMTKD